MKQEHFNSLLFTEENLNSDNIYEKDIPNTQSCQNNKNQQKNKVNYDTLIQFHQIYGNKWKIISKNLPGTSDSFIKNMFYTLTRKSIRKLNTYIQFSQISKINRIKPFKLNFVFKLANLSESERMNNFLKGPYSELLYNLLEIGNLDTNYVKNQAQQTNNLSNQIKQNLQFLIFNLKTIEKIFIEQKLIKKGRTKKKFPKKVLAQKANTSQAFKNNIENTKIPEFKSILSSTSFKQYKDDEIIQSIQKSYQSSQASECELQMVNIFNYSEKTTIEECLEQKKFDPFFYY